VAANENAATPRGRARTLDAIERLTEVKDGGGASLESYTLDPEDNRPASHRSSFHVTDPANRPQVDAKTQFEYDVNGNRVRKTVKATSLNRRYACAVYDVLASASRHSSSDPASAAWENVTSARLNLRLTVGIQSSLPQIPATGLKCATAQDSELSGGCFSQ
jgi:hypothetical protein